MKKILFLGGSKQQVPAIEYAKKQGYFTILCDYLYDNPGQFVADKFYCQSTTDLNKMLDIAKENKIDGIVAYASDPAALTAAYVGNKLNLPSNPYKSVEILSKKNLFREFLYTNGFNCPKALSFKNYKDVLENIYKFKFPVMIKPIDSSGSKGVSKVNSIKEIKEKFEIALKNSREKIVIIEEYIQNKNKYVIGGDAFVINKKIEFLGLMDCYRDLKVNPYVPVGKIYPSSLTKNEIRLIKETIDKILDILDIESGALNLELMFDIKNDLYIIEIGPRNGGNMIPELLQMCTDVNLIQATIENSISRNKINLNKTKEKRYYSTYIIHSNKSGILKSINFNDEIKANLIKSVMYKNSGDQVEKFNGANKALGIVFLKFNSIEEQKKKLAIINKLIEVVI